jgi:hypothetical protein
VGLRHDFERIATVLSGLINGLEKRTASWLPGEPQFILPDPARPAAYGRFPPTVRLIRRPERADAAQSSSFPEPRGRTLSGPGLRRRSPQRGARADPASGQFLESLAGSGDGVPVRQV